MTTDDKRSLLITGASGMIGRTLMEQLKHAGYQPYALSRTDPGAAFYYDQAKGEMHLAESIPLFGVINLAGANLADGRWTARRKQLILDSRVQTTRHLCQALAKLPRKPEVLVSASAIGFYGDTGDSIVDESSPHGTGFLAQVSREWEAATQPTEAAGIRTVILRFGLVLSRQGGVLPNFVLPLQLAAIGRVGDGKHWMPWVALDDCVRVVTQALEQGSMSSPVNVVSNHEVTNDEFTRSLARAINRPRLPGLPATLVRLLFGEMGEEALLVSSRVRTARLAEYGIRLQYPTLAECLSHLYPR